ncbi:transposase [soil metagenome]
MPDPSYTRKLPHLHPTGETLFVTFRIANSLPKEVVLRWAEERDLEVLRLQKAHAADPQKLQEAVHNAKKRSFARFDGLLDTSVPHEHRLDQAALAPEIAGAMHWHQQQGNLDLLCYCIMPNQVHFVATLINPELPFNKIMKSIKTFSAKQINAHVGRTGRFWQREYYDHVVRDGAELQRVVAYVLENPVKAGLCENWEEWPYSYSKIV